MAVLALAGWLLAASGLLVLAAVRRRLAWRSERMARACHEIRGPLSTARLAVALGSRPESLSAAKLRALDLELERAALALADLECARTGWAGHISALRTQVEIRDLLADSVAAWQSSARMRGVELGLRWSGPEATAWAERARLAQALGNLVINALEHGSGPVEVRGARDGATVRIEVLDAGVGLSAPVAELVRRANRGRIHQGWRRQAWPERGRGLAIASEIAQAHGGHLASAPAERGTRIVLTIPVSPPADSARAELF